MPTATKRKKTTARAKTTRAKTTARAKTKTRAKAKPRSAPTKPSATASKPKGLSLHIGLNAVDANHYAGWSGELFACENDARDLAAVATSKGIVPTVLMTRDATRSRVLAGIRAAAKKLTAGDLFLLTYSGHGGQVPDTDDDEADRRDETMCFFDGQFIDDELYLELSKFAKGVRILILSDSCHSGTVARGAIAEAAATAASSDDARPRMMPRAVAEKTYAEHKAFYDRLQAAAARAGRGKLVEPDAALAQVSISDRVSTVVKSFNPAVILISGCQDNQTSMDGNRNGAFTERLLAVWDRGTFTGNYTRFHSVIRSGMLPTQTPNLFTLGTAAPFLSQSPFDVEARKLQRGQS
jgi:hypothetical protein